jgi:hypothetical protein
MNYSISFFLVLFSVWMACKSTKATKTTNTSGHSLPDTTWVVKYDRSPCFGTCPVFSFYLTSANNGLLEARYNFMEPGWYYADLDEESVHALIADLEPEEWWNEDLRNQPEIADLPGKSIVYKHETGLRWYSVGGRVSTQSEYIFGVLDRLVNDAQWRPTDFRPVNPEVPQPSDVIVHLKDHVDINRWMLRFENFGIRLVKKVAPNLQYYVVTWELGKGTANDFLQYIKSDRDVIDAQWDQALNGRQKKSETIRE